MTESKIDPRSITSDFEVALFNTIGEQLPGLQDLGARFSSAGSMPLFAGIGPASFTYSKGNATRNARLQNVPRNQITSATSTTIKQL